MKTANLRLTILALLILLSNSAQYLGYDEDLGFICEDCEEEGETGIAFDPSWVEIREDEKVTVTASWLGEGTPHWVIIKFPFHLIIRQGSVTLAPTSGEDTTIGMRAVSSITQSATGSLALPGQPVTTKLKVRASAQDAEGKSITGERSLEIDGYAPYLERVEGFSDTDIPQVITIATGSPLVVDFRVQRTLPDTTWTFTAAVEPKGSPYLEVSLQPIGAQRLKATLTGKKGDVVLVGGKSVSLLVRAQRSDGRQIKTTFKVNVVIL